MKEHNSLFGKILHWVWMIGVPALAVVWTIAQIVNWNHNVETSGIAFAIFVIFMGLLTLWFYILWVTNRKDPVAWVWEKIQWIISKFKKK
jgi:hypothetical protein